MHCLTAAQQAGRAMPTLQVTMSQRLLSDIQSFHFAWWQIGTGLMLTMQSFWRDSSAKCLPLMTKARHGSQAKAQV